MATTTEISAATRNPFLIYNADGSSRVPRDYKTAVAQETKNGTASISAARMANLRKEGRLHVAYAGSKNEKAAKAAARAAAANAGTNNGVPFVNGNDGIFTSLFPGISTGGSASQSAFGMSSFADTSGAVGGSKNYTGVLLLAGGVALFAFMGPKKVFGFLKHK